MSNNKIKALVMAAAKKVCDDPRIEFDTVEGAKKALYNEIDRASSKILSSNDPAKEFNQYISKTEDAMFFEDLKDANPFFGDFMFDNSAGDIHRFFKILDKGCDALGIPKSPKGDVSLKGPEARDLLKYIADHWNDADDEDADSRPINITLF